MSGRRAFTLVEILVSIGIFMMSSVLMLTALFGATEVFRRGEAARQAGDEATAVIATLQEDLSRVTPVRLRDGKPATEWGRIAVTVDAIGNSRLLLVVENPERSQVRWVDAGGGNRTVVGLRKQVVWRVGPGADATDLSDDELIREEYELGDNGAVVGGALRTDVVTRGCLHFGVWMNVPAGPYNALCHRPVNAQGIGWEAPDPAHPGETLLPPWASEPFDTAANGAGQFWMPPDAIRISLVLTGGGRFATRGYLAQGIGDGDAQARISGIKGLTTMSGSLLRFGDDAASEWIRYDDFRRGTLFNLQRGQLRSSARGWGPRTPVWAGMPFSLVVELPR